ncbi:MAG: YfiR family protein, partial [Cytophagales bacterium]|nr:YfiR family protein [Cytophagales bacterium]
MKAERSLRKIIAPALLCLLMALPTRTVAQTTNYKAYAIFLYNFTKYVHWPAGSLTGDFRITVVGNSKVTQELTAIVQNKTVLGKKIVVTQVNTAQELTGAHLVYLSGGRSGDLEELLQKLAGKPVLVVTERDGLVRKGA